MTPQQIAWWWCCQSDDTRSALMAAFTLFTSNPFATPRSVFDEVLELNGFTNPSPQYDLWIATFQVSFEEITVDGEPAEFVRFNVEFWVALAGFAVAVGFPCPEPCTILKFALDHM